MSRDRNLKSVMRPTCKFGNDNNIKRKLREGPVSSDTGRLITRKAHQ